MARCSWRVRGLLDRAARVSVSSKVVSLLETVGAVTHAHNGKLTDALGPETEVSPAARGKDVETQIVVDLLRMLKQTGSRRRALGAR